MVNHSQSLAHSEDCIANDVNELDLKKLDVIPKLRLHCSSMKEKIDQFEVKVQSSIEDSLKAALWTDKWKIKYEDLMTCMKSHGIQYPESLKNEGRFQSINMLGEIRNGLNKQRSELRDTKIGAEVSRPTAAAELVARGVY